MKNSFGKLKFKDFLALYINLWLFVLFVIHILEDFYIFSSHKTKNLEPNKKGPLRTFLLSKFQLQKQYSRVKITNAIQFNKEIRQWTIKLFKFKIIINKISIFED